MERGPTTRTRDLSVAGRLTEFHAPVEMTQSRQLGGTSAIWGGRCVPYDPIDFQERAQLVGSRWPIGLSDVEPFIQRACDWARIGRGAFSVHDLPHLSPELVPGLKDGGGVLVSTLERWSLPTNFGTEYRAEMESNPHVSVVTGATALRVRLADGTSRVGSVECAAIDGPKFSVEGDNGCSRAVASRRHACCARPGRMGAAWATIRSSGPLVPGPPGRGHRRRRVHDPSRVDDLRLRAVTDGVFVRRRFTFTDEFLQEHNLPNVAGWLTNPELADARHGDGILSFVYLSLISPLGPRFAPDAQRLSLTGTKVPGSPYGVTERSPIRAHLRNLLRDPIRLLRFLFGFGLKRVFAKGRKPRGFFVERSTNRYPFQYHGEHLPSADSVVRLSDVTDALGMLRLDIDLRFSDADVDGGLRVHEHWDHYLRDLGVGRLVYRDGDRAALVRERLGGGFHQVGTTRMSKHADDGAVDANLRVHSVDTVRRQQLGLRHVRSGELHVPHDLPGRSSGRSPFPER